MNRIFHHHDLWEDLQHGMYNPVQCDENSPMVVQAKELLADHKRFYSVLKRMVGDWKYCTEYNLSNTQFNRRAWLGRSACCYEHGIPESCVRVAWFLLSEYEMRLANESADKIIEEFESRYREKKGLFY